MTGHPLFQPEQARPEELTEDERAFSAALLEHTASVPTAGVSGYLGRSDEGSLLAGLSLVDAHPGRLGASVRVSILMFGAHYAGGTVIGDRLHNQLYHLPERPSTWSLRATGSPVELGRRTAEWVRDVLARPVLLHSWLHDGRAYACRYLFGDTGETLVQAFERQPAPAGPVPAGQWPRPAALGTPDTVVHIRGDLSRAGLPAGVPLSTERPLINGVWYE